MLWVKALHIIAVICWMAGLFYLPRLFVYHSMVTDAEGRQRFSVMEQKLYGQIMQPSMAATFIFGFILWLYYGIAGNWLYLKLFLVFLLVGYHHWCGATVKKFANDAIQRDHVFFRWMNEVPVVLMIAVVLLVVLKPSFL